MTKVIYKYALKEVSEFTIDLPTNFKILKIGLQRGAPYLWAEVDVDSPIQTVQFYAVWTGVPVGHISDSNVYVGTTINDQTGMVHHYYMKHL